MGTGADVGEFDRPLVFALTVLGTAHGASRKGCGGIASFLVSITHGGVCPAFRSTESNL